MALVQTTMFPDPIEVPEDEIPVLRAQGLLTEARRPAAEGERRYPITEVPDQSPAGAGEPGIKVTADKPAGPDAGEKPDAKETK